MKINLKVTVINLLYILIAYLPFSSVIANVLPMSGWIKDILCVMIVIICIVACGRLRLNSVTVGVVIYTVSVVFNLIANTTLTLGDKIDAFRYRCEYAITLCILFSSFHFAKDEVSNIARMIMRILYYTGIIVAIIGLVEIVNPSLIYSIYGSGLTAHLSIYSGGVLNTRLISTMSNPINLGLQMALSIMATLYIQFDSKSSADMRNGLLRKCTYWGSIILFCVILLLTYSRTSYIVAVFIFIFYLLIRIFLSKISIRKKTISIICIFAALILFGLFLNYNETIATRFSTIGLESFTESSRFQGAYRTFASNFNIFNIIYGYGVGSSLGVSGQYVFEFGYASILYESGLIGLIIFMSTILIGEICGIKLIKKDKDDNNNIAIPYMSLLIGFMVAMITEDVYFQLPFSLYFWIGIFILSTLFSVSRKNGGEISEGIDKENTTR